MILRPIEVNKPFKLNGWKIYQSSYESDYGKWSITSTVEVISGQVVAGCLFWLFLWSWPVLFTFSGWEENVNYFF